MIEPLSVSWDCAPRGRHRFRWFWEGSRALNRWGFADVIEVCRHCPAYRVGHVAGLGPIRWRVVEGSGVSWH